MRKLTIAVACVALIAGCTRTQAPAIQAPYRITILGDSLAYGAGDESGRGIGGNLARLLNVSVSNLGMNGARTWNVLHLLRTTAARQAIASSDAVILSIGGNDLYGDSFARFKTLVWPQHAMTRTLNRVGLIVAKIRRTNPAARVCLIGLFDPYRSRFLDQQIAIWDSRLIGRFAGDTSIDVVRVADLFLFPTRLSSLDHFHPSAEGYARIAERIAVTLAP